MSTRPSEGMRVTDGYVGGTVSCVDVWPDRAGNARVNWDNGNSSIVQHMHIFPGEPAPRVPQNVPRIVSVVKYYPYRTLDLTRAGRRIYRCDYEPGDEIQQLEEALAVRMGTVHDNHHGWEVRDRHGRTLFFYFSDGWFGVFPQMQPSELLRTQVK